LAEATLTGTDASNYVLDSVATAIASITGKHITGSFTAPDKVYDSTTAATVATRVLTGVASPDVVALMGGTATFADKNVGTNKAVTLTGATLSGADAGNYVLDSLATTTASITVKHRTGSFAAQDKVYDVRRVICAYALANGAIPGDAVSLSGTATFADKSVGTNKTVTGATLTGADAGNYALDSVATATASITAATVTASVTAADKTFDGTTTATITACTLSGVVAGDAVTCAAGSASFSDPNPGANKTVTAPGITLSGAAASNYQLSSTSATTTASIIYGFAGLQSPYTLPSQGAFQIRSTIPLKWQYRNNAGSVINSSAAGPVVGIAGPYTCGGDDSLAAVITVNDAGNSGYQYDSTTNTWQFNWKTTGLTAGCYTIKIHSGQSGQENGPFPIRAKSK
jgi:hypothetical protein